MTDFYELLSARHEKWKEITAKRLQAEELAKEEFSFSPHSLERYDAFRDNSYLNSKYKEEPIVLARDRETQWFVGLSVSLRTNKLIEIDKNFDYQPPSLGKWWKKEISEHEAYRLLQIDLNEQFRRKAVIKKCLADPVRLVYDNTKVKPYCVKVFDGDKYVQVTGWFAVKENAEEVFRRQKREYKIPEKLKKEIDRLNQ